MSTSAVINLSTFFGTHNASFDGLNDSYCTVVWYYIILNDLTDIFLAQNMMHSYLHKDLRNGRNTSHNLIFFKLLRTLEFLIIAQYGMIAQGRAVIVLFSTGLIIVQGRIFLGNK